MVSNAHEQSTANVIAELTEWAERMHHMALNCTLIAIEGVEENPHQFNGMGVAYGNVGDFLNRRIAELQQGRGA